MNSRFRKTNLLKDFSVKWLNLFSARNCLTNPYVFPLVCFHFFRYCRKWPKFLNILEIYFQIRISLVNNKRCNKVFRITFLEFQGNFLLFSGFFVDCNQLAVELMVNFADSQKTLKSLVFWADYQFIVSYMFCHGKTHFFYEFYSISFLINT